MSPVIGVPDRLCATRRLADHRNGLEVEGIEGLAGRQPGLGKLAFEAVAALCRRLFGEGGEEARRGQPSLSAWAQSEAQIA